jgi:hypothetical protein
MHIAGAWILLIFAVIIAAVLLLLLHLTQLGHFLHQQIPDRPHRRLFLASVSFFITFLSVRLLVLSIHHLVWGILLLLITGHATLAEVGTKATPGSIFLSRLLSIGYGVGAALTLDEFALWLNLDAMAYWSRQGRESIDVVVLFGTLLAITTWGAPLWQRWFKPGQKQIPGE